MVKLTLLLWAFLAVAFTSSSSCSQTKAANADTSLFIGSTPCDSLINSMLELPSGINCEFIKWRVSFYTESISTGKFSLRILFGESQPNTNGFKGGGQQKELKGTYTVKKGTSALPAANVYELHSNQIKSSLWLVQMDDNLFHFADSSRNLIVGNGGFGYVLNVLKK